MTNYENMTLAELNAELDKLETEKFYLAMKDYWTQRDFAQDIEFDRNIRKVKELIAAKDGE